MGAFTLGQWYNDKMPEFMYGVHRPTEWPRSPAQTKPSFGTQERVAACEYRVIDFERATQALQRLEAAEAASS